MEVLIKSCYVNDSVDMFGSLVDDCTVSWHVSKLSYNKTSNILLIYHLTAYY